jgi:hypothetical protein
VERVVVAVVVVAFASRPPDPITACPLTTAVAATIALVAATMIARLRSMFDLPHDPEPNRFVSHRHGSTVI